MKTGNLGSLYAMMLRFSGYSDMAVGLGSIFGFRFPESFNYLYISKSITEFWRCRRHISLSFWFKEYLYIPLGGNRVNKERNYLNLLIVSVKTILNDDKIKKRLIIVAERECVYWQKVAKRYPECIAAQGLREIAIIRHCLGAYYSLKKGQACEDASGIALTGQNGKI